MAELLDFCTSHPRRQVEAGEVLISEGAPCGQLYIVVAGSFTVSRSGQTVAVVSDQGAVFGEMSALLDAPAAATVTGTGPATVAVIDDPQAFMVTNPEAVLLIAKGLAGRLGAATAYLADLSQQYGSSSGNLGLIDQVLAKLAFSQQPAAQPGSLREPDPEY